VGVAECDGAPTREGARGAAEVGGGRVLWHPTRERAWGATEVGVAECDGAPTREGVRGAAEVGGGRVLWHPTRE
jgi:hypothetical protein